MSRAKSQYVVECLSLNGPDLVVDVKDKAAGIKWIAQNGVDGGVYRVVAIIVPRIRVLVEKKEIRKLEA